MRTPPEIDAILAQLPAAEQRAATEFARRLNKVCVEVVHICAGAGVVLTTDRIEAVEDAAIALLIASKRAVGTT